MKKKVTIITLCLATLIAGEAAAQKKQKAVPFKLSGTIRNFTGKTLYVHHIWEEKEFTDSMKVTDGKFSIELKSPESNMYWINTAPFVNAPPNVMFFSDPKAEIKASIHADSIPFAVITGGPSQKDYTDYKAMLNGFVSKQQKMQAAYTEAMQKGDAAAMETIRNDFQNLNNDFINGMSYFVKQHPKSPVSGYIVYNDMNNPAVPFLSLIHI